MSDFDHFKFFKFDVLISFLDLCRSNVSILEAMLSNNVQMLGLPRPLIFIGDGAIYNNAYRNFPFLRLVDCGMHLVMVAIAASQTCYVVVKLDKRCKNDAKQSRVSQCLVVKRKVEK